MKKLLIAILLLCVLMSACSEVEQALWDPDPMTVSCSDETFIAKVVELSEESTNLFAVQILKIYDDVELVSRSEKLLECTGTALTNSAGETPIFYSIEVDREGDTFIGYRLQ